MVAQQIAMIDRQYPFFDALGGVYIGGRQVLNVCGVADNSNSILASQLRNSAGTATGGNNLSNITGRWLRGSTGIAGRIPGQIATQLRGRSFSSFDEFRSAFWQAIASDRNLSQQFRRGNRSLMSTGKAPVAPKSQQVGGQVTYQLHHVQPIHAGGGVYNLDNIVIVTPRYHQEMLEPRYHYNR